MKINKSHLTYCLNIHPGESWDENLAAIRKHSTKVKAAVAPDKPFGLGLRLSAAAAEQLSKPGEAKRVKAELDALGMYAFTVNAFPYGQFHGTRIKEKVYQPDWSTEERLRYTCQTADILADLLPDKVSGSISTLPVGYNAAGRTGNADLTSAARMLAKAAAHLAGIKEKKGRTIRLALEPEPDCLIENSATVMAFFHDHLFPAGPEHIMREHIGICLDTCHFDVIFEDACNAYRKITADGIKVPKIQLSSAVRLIGSLFKPITVKSLIDETYLHQTRIRRKDGMIERVRDLSADKKLLDELADAPEARVHYHIPLYGIKSDSMSGTRGFASTELIRYAEDNGTDHFEIETYTYGFLKKLVESDVDNSIIREYQAVKM